MNAPAAHAVLLLCDPGVCHHANAGYLHAMPGDPGLLHRQVCVEEQMSTGGDRCPGRHAYPGLCRHDEHILADDVRIRRWCPGCDRCDYGRSGDEGKSGTAPVSVIYRSAKGMAVTPGPKGS